MNTYESHLIILVKQMLLISHLKTMEECVYQTHKSVREVHMVQGGTMKEEGMKQLVFH